MLENPSSAASLNTPQQPRDSLPTGGGATTSPSATQKEMEQNSSLLVREESGPTVTAVYPGARKSEFVATVVHLTTQTVLPDFFGAVLHLQRTDLPI